MSSETSASIAFGVISVILLLTVALVLRWARMRANQPHDFTTNIRGLQEEGAIDDDDAALLHKPRELPQVPYLLDNSEDKINEKMLNVVIKLNALFRFREVLPKCNYLDLVDLARCLLYSLNAIAPIEEFLSGLESIP